MTVAFSKKAERDYRKLPRPIQGKADKQFSLLITNYRHPSLRTKKMRGLARFEGRIDIHYRFTFLVEQDTISILTIGTHDEGLGRN